MCGIICIWHKDGAPVPETLLSTMTDRLRHRGPDNRQTWIDGPLGFGHTRLKVLDLSDAANQPFTDGHDRLIYNGEIFNHLDLRRDLEAAYSFETRSDTETLFRCLQAWGADALDRLSGQFAFVFFDAGRRRLLIARDHVGICPLYRYETDRAVYLASEIAPLLEVAPRTFDAGGVLDYLTYRYNIQNGRTLFRGISRFAPAHVEEIDLSSGDAQTRRYWRLRFAPQDMSLAEAEKSFQAIFDGEVSRQKVADVPVGVFLSGGIDSSSLVKGYSRNGTAVHSYSLVFGDDTSELAQIRTLERAYGFDSHIETFPGVGAADLDTSVRRLEDPFGDLIICANDFLAARASADVTAVLSGEGGDEAFIGYDHQRGLLKLLRLARLPLARTAIAAVLRLLGPAAVAQLQSYPGQFGRQELDRVIAINNQRDTASAYLKTVSLFDEAELGRLLDPRFVSEAGASPDTAPIRRIFDAEDSTWKAVMRAEIEQLTLVINLLKQDRFCMAHSVEGRVPLASRAVLEFAATLPPSILAGGDVKPILKAYADLKDARKRAFSLLSTGHYLKGLVTLMERYATRDTVNEMGVFAWPEIEVLRQRLTGGTMLAAKQVMAVVVLIAFWRTFQLARA